MKIGDRVTFRRRAGFPVESGRIVGRCFGRASFDVEIDGGKRINDVAEIISTEQGRANIPTTLDPQKATGFIAPVPQRAITHGGPVAFTEFDPKP